MAERSVAEVMDSLGLAQEGFRALGLLPLVHVASADGAIQMSERSCIRDFARAHGWLAGGGEVALATWLERRPSAADLLEGTRRFGELAREGRGLGASIPARAIGDALVAARAVAAASGGLFGLREAVVPAEERALQEVADALLGEDGTPWRELCARVESAGDPLAGGPAGHFLVGSAPEFVAAPMDFLTDAWRRHGDVIRVRLGPRVVHVLVHPDAVRHVLVDNHRNYKRSPTIDEVRAVGGESLFTADGDPWRARRRLLQPGFHQHKIAAMADGMSHAIAEILDEWSAAAIQHRPLDMAAQMGRLALRIAGRAMFHVDTDDDAADMIDAVSFLLEHVRVRSGQLVKLPRAIPTPTHRRYHAARATIERIVKRTLSERRARGDTHHDVLGLLMDARDADTGAPLSDQELVSELTLLFIVGHETTAITLAWTLYLLSLNPSARVRLEEECARVVGDRVAGAADVFSLAWMGQCLDESQRLYPAVWINGRTAIADDEIAGHRIPAASDVFLAHYLTHRHPAFWDNPEAFDPDRFAPEQVAARHPHAHVPFGAGPRKCIGYSFAQLEMRLALAAIVRRFRVDVAPAFVPTLDPSLTLRPRDGMWMTVHTRD